MELQNIKDTINNYNYLIVLAKKIIAKLEILDGSTFNTFKGVEDISFDDKNVNVICDDSCYGSSDKESFIFPLSYLSLNDRELTDAVYFAKKTKDAQNLLLKVQKEQTELHNKEQAEYNQYLLLKEKYESNG